MNQVQRAVGIGWRARCQVFFQHGHINGAATGGGENAGGVHEREGCGIKRRFTVFLGHFIRLF